MFFHYLKNINGLNRIKIFIFNESVNFILFEKKNKKISHSKFQVFIFEIVIKQRKIILPTSKKPLLV